jgi:proline iminopeptidase
LKKKLFYPALLIILCLNVCAQEEGTIESDGSKLFYRTFGSGEPLLIINGGPGMNSDGFAPLAETLSKNNKTIIYDQRGTGKSIIKMLDSTTVTMDLMVKDIENLRKHLGINQWNILGHSFGGMLASYYATLHPGRIRSLILSSSGGVDLGLLRYASSTINTKLTTGQLQQLRFWTGKISEGDTSYHARLQRALALAPAYVYDKKHVPAIAERLTQGNTEVNRLVWQDMNRINFNCKEKLGSASFPVLVIQGKDDIVTAETAMQSKNAFKYAKIVWLDDTVHYGWLDNPGQYFKAIQQLLSREGL